MKNLPQLILCRAEAYKALKKSRMGPQSSKKTASATTGTEEVLAEILNANLSKAASKKIQDSARICIGAVQYLAQLDASDLTQLVKDSYAYVQKTWTQSCKNRPENSKEESLRLLEAYEKLICSSCYDILFYHRSDDEVLDLSLQDRIRSLKWVTAGFLETNLAMENSAVARKLDLATRQLLKMNQRTSPKEKLDCIVACSHFVLEAAELSQKGKPAGADDFLPALIYVVLKSNPPLFQSNMDFIARFSLPINLSSGETAYYYTSLVCAKEYIQNLQPQHLDVLVSKEDFDAYVYSNSPGVSTSVNSSCFASQMEKPETSFSFDAEEIEEYRSKTPRPESPTDYLSIAACLSEEYSADVSERDTWLELFDEDFKEID